MPEECRLLRQVYFECRRGQLVLCYVSIFNYRVFQSDNGDQDMRNRIRGNRWGEEDYTSDQNKRLPRRRCACLILLYKWRWNIRIVFLIQPIEIIEITCRSSLVN